MNRSFVFVVSCLLLIVTVGRADAQWARFRGPNGSGVDSSVGYPVEFSPTKNVAWKASVPYGQSSPVVVGTRLYGTASEGDRLITFCLDTRTGRELWRREVRRERVQAAYKANDPASPTPAADESGVVAFFPEFGLVSYNNDGQARWTSRLGPFKNFYGMAGSPIIDGGHGRAGMRPAGGVLCHCARPLDRASAMEDRPTRHDDWVVDADGLSTGRDARGPDCARLDASRRLRPRVRRPALVAAGGIRWRTRHTVGSR